ncbi:hypothetical protein Cal7507_4614 [Calothrix sp. PCC 7507]|nr:hypothetical protein Cal7507_4614 [Calothrix sp. PCC 7507]
MVGSAHPTTKNGLLQLVQDVSQYPDLYLYSRQCVEYVTSLQVTLAVLLVPAPA